MPRACEKPTVARHIHLFEDDWHYMLQHYGPGSSKPLGAAAVVRTLVHAWVLKMRARMLAEESASGAEAFAEVLTDLGLPTSLKGEIK